MKIWVLNGPNINFLGIREPQVYGKENYQNLVSQLEEKGNELAIKINVLQTNEEGKLIDYIQEAYYEQIDGILINPGGYTHTSIALLDAILAVGIPTVEVHLSNIEEREAFRRISYIRNGCKHVEMGEGIDSYIKGLKWLKEYILKHK